MEKTGEIMYNSKGVNTHGMLHAGKRIACALLAVAAFCICAEAYHIIAKNPGVSTGYLKGHSTYEIDIRDNGAPAARSRLEWPLNGVIAGPEINVLFADGTSLGLRYRASVTGSPGDLKDYDFILGQQALLGEIGTAFRARIFDISLAKIIFAGNGFALEAGAAFEHQEFNWDADGVLKQTVNNAYGTLLTGLPAGAWDLGKEKWISYNVKYSLPSVGLKSIFSAGGRSSFFARIKIIYVSLVDEDNHIQRFKMSTSEQNGWGASLGGGYDIRLTRRLTAGLSADYTKLSASGAMEQFYYGGTLSGTRFTGIDASIESEQMLLNGKMIYRF